MREFGGIVECTIPAHKCCDICERECDCGECKLAMSVSECEVEEIDIFDNASTPPTPPLPKDKQKQLYEALIEYRETLCEVVDSSGHQIPLLFGTEIPSGLPDSIIKSIVKDCKNIHSVSDVVKLGIISNQHALKIFEIINSIL